MAMFLLQKDSGFAIFCKEAFVTDPSKSLDKEFVMSVFDRCLIPCLYHENTWMMYIKWLTKKNISDEVVVDIYQKANTFLPLDLRNILTVMVVLRQYRVIVNDLAQSGAIAYDGLHFVFMSRHSFKNSLDQSPKEILEKQTSFTKILEL
ncbi:CBM_collapsed_G0043150.mRNA.1.CDS.1 [Saccharomyces cerevisiae]|nr:CBM_collapsed_G0043150.mRNA.1.CDS.1 [Saccharomyces cerevisiae]